MPIVLNATNMSLIAKLAGAPATTNPDFICSWADKLGQSMTPGNTNGTLNGTTEVTLVAAPAADTQRIVNSIIIANCDTAVVTLTLQLAVAAARKNILPATSIPVNAPLRIGEAIDVEVGQPLDVTVEGGGVIGQFSTVQAGEAVGGNRVVITDDDGLIYYADCTDLDHIFRVTGVTTGAISLGAVGSVQTFGEMIEGSWTWTPGLPIFVSTNGLLTQTPPASGFSKVIAEARTATKIFIEQQTPLVLAA